MKGDGGRHENAAPAPARPGNLSLQPPRCLQSNIRASKLVFLNRPGLPVDDVVAVDHAVDRLHVLQRGACRLDKRRHEAELDAVPLKEGILQGRVAEKVLRAVVLNGARCGLMRAV